MLADRIRGLTQYVPESTMEQDFDAFWASNLRQSGKRPLGATAELVDYPSDWAKVYDVCYEGEDGTPIHGWYIVPTREAGTDNPNGWPVVVIYHGYSIHRGLPHEYMHWVMSGMAVFTVDTRGRGLTPDYAQYPQGGFFVGSLTKGILDHTRHFYKHAYIDCVRAIDFVSSREEVDPQRIGVSGTSQGGGLAIAVAALDDRVKLLHASKPFLCHFTYAIECNSTGPCTEVNEWFKRYDSLREQQDQVYRTLSYFDGMNMATRVRVKTLMSVGLKDSVCQPETVYAAFNHLPSEKEMLVYADIGHEEVQIHVDKYIRFFKQNL